MHSKKHIIPITLLLLWSLYSPLTKAQLTEQEATPAVISEPGAKITITEVSFKNTLADRVKMTYNSPSNKPINLKGISFADDNTFKEIEEDFIIASGQNILLTFKSDKTDEMPYLYASKSGLTGTTEQIIIYDQNNGIIDAVCWTSSKPTESEKEELAELFEKEGWNSPDINSCILSDNIEKDQSITRKGLTDTNSKEDWNEIAKIEEQLTSPAIQELQEPETPTGQTTESHQEATKPTQEIITPPKIIEVKEPITPPNTTKTKSTSKKTSSKSYKNGDLSNNIIINEILPNPEGSDTKKEWVELYNKGENNVNLGNWTLDDSEDGSKPYKIPGSITIKAKETVLIESKDSKLSLGNKEDAIRLFNYNEELVDEVSYEESPSGQSYSLIPISKEDGTTSNKWIWTADLSPNTPNPRFREFTAEIKNEPKFEENYSFEVIDKNDQTKIILFEEELIAGPLAKAVFTTGSTILLTVEQTENDTFLLKKYEIISKGTEGNKLPVFIIPSIIGTIILISGIAFFLVYKKIPWQETKPSV